MANQRDDVFIEPSSISKEILIQDPDTPVLLESSTPSDDQVPFILHCSSTSKVSVQESYKLTNNQANASTIQEASHHLTTLQDILTPTDEAYFNLARPTDVLSSNEQPSCNSSCRLDVPICPIEISCNLTCLQDNVCSNTDQEGFTFSCPPDTLRQTRTDMESSTLFCAVTNQTPYNLSCQENISTTQNEAPTYNFSCLQKERVLHCDNQTSSISTYPSDDLNSNELSSYNLAYSQNIPITCIEISRPFTHMHHVVNTTSQATNHFSCPQDILSSNAHASCNLVCPQDIPITSIEVSPPFTHMHDVISTISQASSHLLCPLDNQSSNEQASCSLVGSQDILSSTKQESCNMTRMHDIHIIPIESSQPFASSQDVICTNSQEYSNISYPKNVLSSSGKISCNLASSRNISVTSDQESRNQESIQGIIPCTADSILNAPFFRETGRDLPLSETPRNPSNSIGVIPIPTNSLLKNKKQLFGTNLNDNLASFKRVTRAGTEYGRKLQQEVMKKIRSNLPSAQKQDEPPRAKFASTSTSVPQNTRTKKNRRCKCHFTLARRRK